MTEVFINEFHYDNVGADTGEAVEIVAPIATDLSGWRLVLYNGGSTAATAAAATVYGTVDLAAGSVVVRDLGNGFKTLVVTFPQDGLQNGSPDGFAIIDAQGQVVQFLSYEGVMTAAAGTPAAGVTSIDIGRVEGTSTPVGTSLQLTGSGTSYEDFTWAASATSTFGGANNNQTLGAAQSAGTLSIADTTTQEGDSGTHDLVFTVTRAGGSAGAVSAAWTLTLGTADAADLGSNASYSGTVTFADGATSAEIRIPVAGDTEFEANETLTVTLSAPTGGAALGTASATGTIVNDDTAPPSAAANVFINEIHYDNSGTDVGEGIEVAGTAGTSLSGWSLVFYNGGNGQSYKTVALSGTIADQSNGFGTLSVAVADIQNGSPDGVALVDAQGRVIQFLSYEGSFTAVGGPADGMVSTDIGVAEEPAPGTGMSLQLKGAGSSAADFTWTAASTASFGGINAGQTFYAADGTAHLRVDDARVAEGNEGTSDLVFTVHRAGGTDRAAEVDYTIELGTLSADDLAAGQSLSGTVSFAAGETSKQIVVKVQGDTVGEDNETLTLHLVNAPANAVFDDADAVGTVVNDDFITLGIYDIQGAGHQSAYVGQEVATTGIVTQITANGFYVQDATGDGNAATSDAIFVFTRGAVTVTVGDAVNVSGTVAEYAADAVGLTVTEIDSPSVTVTSSGNALPQAVLIGAGGLLPPSTLIDDDGLRSFDPATDGIDFYESLEGMLVTIDNPLVIQSTNSYGETYVVASGGEGATGVSSRGGLTLSAGDFNPERIQIDNTSANYVQGDYLSSVTGVVSYSFDTYEVLAQANPAVIQASTLARETTALQGDADHLSVATYNVENLDPSDNKYTIIANDIIYNLGAPDIVSLQEVQDDNGAGTGVLTAAQNLTNLVDALNAADPTAHYVYAEIAPSAANTTGGEPNGNIRNAFVYDTNRVSLVPGTLELIEDPAFANSRRPLVGTFEFNGQQVNVVDIHFYSRGGSDADFGANQPPTQAGDARRTAMAEAVAAYINDHLADDPGLNYAVMGDFNGFYYETALTTLAEQAGLTNLTTLLPQNERYSYQYEGNLQQFDYILVSDGLTAGAQYDSVHINAEFDTATRPTDHDPQVALLALGAGLTGDAGANRLTGGAAAERISGLDGDDVLTGRGGADQLFGGEGNDTLQGDEGDDLLSGGSGDDKLSGMADNDTLYGGTGNDQLDGGTGNDILYGEAGNDKMQGRDGDDVLIGGAGKDDMTGGAGADTFRFLATTDSAVGQEDLIRDFTHGADRIDLSAIDAVAGGTDDAFTLVAAFDGHAGQLVQTFLFRNTYALQGDVDGDGVADFSIIVLDAGRLVASDLVL